jgi:predicted TIM-barrel fold metal-dependent hydrolase
MGVMLSEYAPITSGIVTNEYTSRFCAGRSELIPFGSICLYNENDESLFKGGEGDFEVAFTGGETGGFTNEVPLEEQAERAIKSLGIRGFKMLPTYAHFYPNDRRLFGFYETVQSLQVPLMFHTGTSIFKGSLVKYGDPLFLDDVADAFPGIPILLEHGGRPFWYDRAAWLITRHRNVHIGIAGIPTRHLSRHFPHLERFQDRFIFGSDWPGMPRIKPLVEKVLELPFNDGVKEKILSGNAGRILGIA